eukprot:TRINITY_DN21872_c0_g1_i1.p1 TRINITY_DN21872_c0_g1~~TRINITY_DN21872_c0_g1_i1.p1  ORF type:complete len:391 (-),score=81.97 TRINITY_DN21872_c0_g1_i1:31-1203(-)
MACCVVRQKTDNDLPLRTRPPRPEAPPGSDPARCTAGLAKCLGGIISRSETESHATSQSQAEQHETAADSVAISRPKKPGTIGGLTAEQEQRLAELEALLAAEPPPRVEAHALEGHKRRLVRFLRGDKFVPEVAAIRIREHAQWWLDYGMDSFVEADEFDENGVVFVCGQDRFGQPTLVARPCVHKSNSYEESTLTVRRCVYTMQRCVERLSPGLEQISLIYDCHGAQTWNMDYTFSVELMHVFARQFPERMGRVVVINAGVLITMLWSTVSALMDPVTREKICFCNTGFEEELLKFVTEDHPYLRYAAEVKQAQDAREVPLPRASPYVARWRDAVAADAVDPNADGAAAALPEAAVANKTLVATAGAAVAEPRLRRYASSLLKWVCCRV